MTDFDKEQEREKLREQLERDQERRRTTEQMSELLLKGATMLNAHCGECKTPIFRHEGEEFCPTCERTVDQIQTAEPADSTHDGADTEEVPATSPTPDVPDEDTQDVEPPEEPDAVDAADAEPEAVDEQPPASGPVGQLEATIERLAARASTAEDPRQAGEFLDAAYRAAETRELLRH